MLKVSVDSSAGSSLEANLFATTRSCSRLHGGVVYGTDNDGKIYGTKIAKFNNEVVPFLCEIWVTTMATIGCVMFYGN